MHHGQNREKQKHVNKQKTKLNENKGELQKFAERGRKFRNVVEIVGICNMHHWLRAVLSNLFDPARSKGAYVLSGFRYCAGTTRHNHEAAGRTSNLKSNNYNSLNINIL